ncbi:MAG: hypothetical protein FJ308_20540 [Planctomycetes bacterium]|nr:hypothetical protein [Planctomycetota bacterium]
MRLFIARFATVLVGFFSLLLAVETSVAQESSVKLDPSGTWRWEYDLDGTHNKDLVRLDFNAVGKTSADKELKGTYESSSGRKVAIENGKVDGGKVSFQFKINYQGMDVKLEFEGTVKDDALNGTVHASTSEGSRDLPWTANRTVEAEDVVGTWKMRIDAGGNVLEPEIVISRDGQTLKGKYKSGTEVELDGVEVKVVKNELKFLIDTSYQGTKIKADYRGRPYGNKVRGTIDYDLGGNAGTIDFSGTRSVDTK